MGATRTAEVAPPPGECRSCRTFCDKLIEPRDCLAMRCPYLWSYVDGPTGRRFMGCVQKVFRGSDLRQPRVVRRKGQLAGELGEVVDPEFRHSG